MIYVLDLSRAKPPRHLKDFELVPLKLKAGGAFRVFELDVSTEPIWSAQLRRAWEHMIAKEEGITVEEVASERRAIEVHELQLIEGARIVPMDLWRKWAPEDF